MIDSTDLYHHEYPDLNWCARCGAPENACMCCQNDFQPCSDCDTPDACWDFGCAIEQGIIEPRWT